MLQPPRPQVAGPVFPDPPTDRVFPEVAAGPLALDPLVLGGLALAVVVHAQTLDSWAGDATHAPVREIEKGGGRVHGRTHIRRMNNTEDQRPWVGVGGIRRVTGQSYLHRRLTHRGEQVRIRCKPPSRPRPGATIPCGRLCAQY